MGEARTGDKLMADGAEASRDYRPILFGRVGPVANIEPRTGRNNDRIRFLRPQETRAKLDSQMQRAAEVFAESGAQLASSIQSADPQLVLVLEALDERTDLTRVARALDLEILIEIEDAVDPDEEVEIRSDRPQDPQIVSCLHAICLNQAAMNKILVAWRSWRRNGQVAWGLGDLGALFSHLRDVRPWGPADRVRATDWDEYFAGRLPGQSHLVEIELWYRSASAVRARALEDVTQLVVADGGEVLSIVEDQSIGYLALKCEIADVSLRSLAAGQYESVALIRSADVLFLKVQGQGILPSALEVAAAAFMEDLPTGNPRVVVLDGVPAANHPRLTGRIVVSDPDDLTNASEATVEKRRHGTWMASAVVWGDIAEGLPPLRRPVLVRPVLVPSASSIDGVEEFPSEELVPDLMRRIFRELFSGRDDTGLTIVNISLGDPALPFDAIMSSWARILDWLSFEYGVLVVVSAGNHRA
jgi:hypothetical protein